MAGGEKARILDDSEPQRPAPTPILSAGRHKPIILKKLVAKEAKISGREFTITGGNDVALTVTLGLESDSDGTFSLGGIVPGDYVLLAIKDGWDLEWSKSEALRPYYPRGKKCPSLRISQ